MPARGSSAKVSNKAVNQPGPYKCVVIQKDEVFAARSFRTSVARGDEAAICLVAYINNAWHPRYGLCGFIRRAIIHNYDFKALAFVILLKRR